MRSQSVRTVVAIMVVGGMALAACGDDGGGGGASAGGGGNEASAPGVSEDTYTIGFIGALSGVAAPNNQCMVQGAEARIGRQNAEGGVHGREIQLEVADDGSTPEQNQSASQSLVQTQDVFMVINNSPFTFGGARWLTQNEIPVVGGGYDGNEWFEEGSENMVSIAGNSSPNFPQFTNTAQFIKDQGGTRAATLGYGDSPSSSTAAQKFGDFAGPAVGLDVPYVNTSVPFGSVDVQSIVLDMRSEDIDSAYLPMNNNTNFAIVTGARQAGVDMKVAVSATGYGQTLLDQPTALREAEGAYFQTGFKPAEVEDEATQQLRDDLATHGDFTGVPGFDCYQGYVSADLVIRGLEEAGQNPTRESFLDALHEMGTYDGGGLLARNVDISLEGFGQAQEETCTWFVQVVDGQFVPVPESGEPVCGELIPESDT